MRKALKTIFIIILCLAAVGGTSYLFFVNLNKADSAFKSVNQFVYGASQKELVINMRNIATTGGDRFNLIINSYQDMQDSLFCINSYLLNFKNSSAERKICDKITSLNSSSANLKLMIEEYNIKSQTDAFDKVLGADDLYEAFADHVAQSAELVLLVKDSVVNETNTSSIDVKFSVIDVYANVVKLSLKGLKIENSNNLENLSYMQSHFTLTNGYLQTVNVGGNFASVTNKFIEKYASCNKNEFAANLKSNLNVANSNSSTNELIASYYLLQILGN